MQQKHNHKKFKFTLDKLNFVKKYLNERVGLAVRDLVHLDYVIRLAKCFCPLAISITSMNTVRFDESTKNPHQTYQDKRYLLLDARNVSL